ncbi:ATP-binding protein [Mycolicibacterium litorale]|uniref:Anti-sigma regulatory factor n=1 Tax=Mycolicibacterium litorale TaxID=758802 RepID=A0AAD1ISP8_9MYCO|nr:ATP-binding protein [Mycolicibacterium litorale]MCV7417606.1 ATP-binding protein [Mycolicibacterium litorale]TDX99874.1 anti-sigma regulatory factor (Ser/Thr protein kinase) [Mycolicibacterium litorale]BBY18832.1 anti-sigma regulatory factor [Mycolicibacterium litorale]
MSSSSYQSDGADLRFLRMGAADAHAVARLREEFTKWLCDHFELDDVRSSDIVLVVNEALSNAAEFAYPDREMGDNITLQTTYLDNGTLAITIADRGRWRQSDTSNQKRSRGRGIPLMRALSDRLDIDRTPQGTQVHLYFDRCQRRAPVRSGASAQASGLDHAATG